MTTIFDEMELLVYSVIILTLHNYWTVSFIKNENVEYKVNLKEHIMDFYFEERRSWLNNKVYNLQFTFTSQLVDDMTVQKCFIWFRIGVFFVLFI